MTGTRVLELGAGTGVPGIVSARLKAARVVFTELPHVLPITEKCVKPYTEASTEWCSIEYHELLWGTPLHELPWVQASEPFDIIVGADVLYRDFDDLFESIVSLMARNTITFLSYERRRRDLSQFFRRFESAGFECDVLSSPMLDHCSECANVCIMRIRHLPRAELVRARQKS